MSRWHEMAKRQTSVGVIVRLLKIPSSLSLRSFSYFVLVLVLEADLARLGLENEDENEVRERAIGEQLFHTEGRDANPR